MSEHVHDEFNSMRGSKAYGDMVIPKPQNIKNIIRNNFEIR
jgi:hypothetical protein